MGKDKKEKKAKKVEESEEEEEEVIEKKEKKEKKDKKEKKKKEKKVVEDSESEDEEKEVKKSKKKAKKEEESAEEVEAEAEAEEKPKEVAKAAGIWINPEDDGKTELIVTNMGAYTWKDGLKKFFEQYGTLIKCKHIYDSNKAYIEYGSHADAAAAQVATNGTMLNNSILNVRFSTDKPRAEGSNVVQAGETTTVFCGNLTFTTTEETVQEIMDEIGEVVKIRMAKDPRNGNFKGFCYVEFTTTDEAIKAVTECN